MKTVFTSGIALAVAIILSVAFRPADEKNFATRKDLMIKDWERVKAYTKEYLDVAKEETLDFKPTPEMRSFGEQMLHLAENNYMLIATATGKTSPYKYGDLEKGPLKTKSEVSDAVMKSYDFVIATLKEMDETKMKKNIKLFNFDMNIETAFAKTFEHQTHHRGQTTVYLRLNGLTPPQEKLF